MKRLEIKAEMLDGRVLETRTSLRDYVLYETTAKRQKPPWGGLSDNPSLWEAFISWAALRRTGQYAGSFEGFQAEVDIVEALTPEDVPESDPTTAEVGDGSS